ncbi:MAG: histidine kinase [Arcobacter sp.]|nr:MAG: histidine kinase [Arcobacter sp.]
MNPIDEFIILLNKRLVNNFNEIEEKIQNNFILFLVILFIFIIGNIILYKLMKKSLLKIIELEVEKNQYQLQKIFQQSRLAQMGEMISMIAHQWRQPLASLSSIAGTLSMDIMMDEYKKEFFQEKLESIGEISQHLSSTINDFRDFYKPDKNKVTAKFEEIVRKSLTILKGTLINDNIEIIEKYNSEQEIGLYDSEMIQVVLNILKNAQDNFKEKDIKNPYIKITTENKIISICDNGGGIPEDIIEKIFDPYFSTKDEKDGTGLGLYMSKTIIEDHHNGKLSVQNTDDGVCFIIELGITSEENSDKSH